MICAGLCRVEVDQRRVHPFLFKLAKVIDLFCHVNRHPAGHAVPTLFEQIADQVVVHNELVGAEPAEPIGCRPPVEPRGAVAEPGPILLLMFQLDFNE